MPVWSAAEPTASGTVRAVPRSTVGPRRAAVVVLALVCALALLPAAADRAAAEVGSACPSEVPPSGFSDVRADSPHASAIDCIAWWRIARGTTDGRFGGSRAVTRGQMTAFVARLVRTPGGRLPASPGDHFGDDDGSVHHFSINRLAATGVVRGRDEVTFDADRPVTRAQVASFLVEAYRQRTGRDLPTGGGAFDDTGSSVHRANIESLAAAGIAHGTAPRRFSPDTYVSRAHMAAFVSRTLELLTEEGEVTDSPASLRAASDLRGFGDCEELLSVLKERALEQVGPRGLGGGAGGGPVAEPVAEAPTDGGGDEGSPGGDTPRSGPDFSDTNVQESGVDEPDVVKTDGARLLTVTGGVLRDIDVTGSSPVLRRSRDLGPGWGHALLLRDQRALVTSSEWEERATAVLRLVDVATLRDTSTLQVDGDILSARMVDGVARVVVRSEPDRLDFSEPERWDEAAFAEATARNRRVVEDSTIEDWLPRVRVGGAERPLLDCADVSHPPEFAGLGTLSVITVDLDAGAFITEGSSGVLAGGETVYASPTGLYVVTTRWDVWTPTGEPEDGVASEVHTFDIAGRGAARYLASGEVPGWTLNQFSLSEHEGHLRVATTSSPTWWGGTEDSESQVTVLRREGDRLLAVGSVGGLGRGERIYAVRFLGDAGYVVTFRETDPLYTLDLSQPTAPRVTGELKIAGYSAYLHPAGEDLLIGVGQDATEEGRRLGTQLSLFDVSDPTAPRRLHRTTVEGGSSEVEYDHRAFLYWPATGLVMLPIQRWSWDEETQTEERFIGAIGWRMTTTSGFEEVGRLTHDDGSSSGGGDPAPAQETSSEEPAADEPLGEWRDPAIRRSIVIRDALYTLSDHGVMTSDLRTLDERAWLGFE